MADPRLVADVGRAEDARHVYGENFTAYRDSLGNWTIGYGHLLDQSIDWTGHQITQKAADALLSMDLDERTAACRTLPEWPSLDTPCRQNAVIECVFNLGLEHWIEEFPHTRAAIKAKQWTEAQTALLDSPEWIAEVGHARVARLADYLRNGFYSLSAA